MQPPDASLLLAAGFEAGDLAKIVLIVIIALVSVIAGGKKKGRQAPGADRPDVPDDAEEPVSEEEEAEVNDRRGVAPAAERMTPREVLARPSRPPQAPPRPPPAPWRPVHSLEFAPSRPPPIEQRPRPARRGDDVSRRPEPGRMPVHAGERGARPAHAGKALSDFDAARALPAERRGGASYDAARALPDEGAAGLSYDAARAISAPSTTAAATAAHVRTALASGQALLRLGDAPPRDRARAAMVWSAVLGSPRCRSPFPPRGGMPR